MVPKEDREARRFEAMYEEYGSRIFRFCHRLCRNRHDAEDLTQEVFVAAFQGYGRFAGRASVSTWLYKIALYRWRARKEGRRTEVPLDSEAAGSDPTAARIERLDLDAALAALPDPLREAFVLVKAEGLTCREAARALGIPEGTLKFRVHQAVQRLQAGLDEGGQP